MAAISCNYGIFFTAWDKGYFREEGLEMTMIKAGGGIATPALMSGAIYYSTSSAAALSTIIKEAPLKIVFAQAEHPSVQLWSGQPHIKTLADLKGKQIGVTTRGDTNEITTRVALKAAGVDPSSVIFTPLG